MARIQSWLNKESIKLNIEDASEIKSTSIQNYNNNCGQ